MVRRVPSKHRNAPIARQKDKDAFLRFGMLLIIGLGLTSGFVYAGRQHFTALKFGYETENLRRERDQLTAEERRLILQREETASPVHLEQAAKRLGMQALQPGQIDPLRQGGPRNDRAAVVRAKDAKDAKEKPAKRELEKSLKAAAKPQIKSQRKPI